MARTMVPYEHESHNLSAIYIGFSDRFMKPRTWYPAYRDIRYGARVVWVRKVDTNREVWVKDANGARLIPRSGVILEQ